MNALAFRHMLGQGLESSPFVSVARSHRAAAMSEDPMLRTIIHGEWKPGGGPWKEGAREFARAPDIAVLSVPRSRLILPENIDPHALSVQVAETEALFLGADLQRFLVGWTRNRYGPGK